MALSLIIDTETSGLYRRDRPADDPAQPWIVSIGATLVDANGADVGFVYTTIDANGRSISAEAQKVHGITRRDVLTGGVDELYALSLIFGVSKRSFVRQASAIVAHNIEFDVSVVESVLARANKPSMTLRRPGLTHICTMKSSTPFCRIQPAKPRDDGSYKWPSLDQACEILLGEPPREGFHGAWDDMQRCRRLYLWLRERGAFEAAA